MPPKLRNTLAKEGLLFLACATVGFVVIPAVLLAIAEIEFGEFYESLFSPSDAVFTWTVALAPYVLCQASRLALPFLKPRPFREEIRLVPEYLKCVLVVVGTGILFAVIWTFFSWGVNPLLIQDIFEHGADQSRMHLLAVDSIDFIRNHGVVQWWYVLAILYFSWTARKKQERAGLRRVGIALYLAPFVALTVVFVLAAFMQVKMPNKLPVPMAGRSPAMAHG